jgi:hypothetical protein
MRIAENLVQRDRANRVVDAADVVDTRRSNCYGS